MFLRARFFPDDDECGVRERLARSDDKGKAFLSRNQPVVENTLYWGATRYLVLV